MSTNKKSSDQSDAHKKIRFSEEGAPIEMMWIGIGASAGESETLANIVCNLPELKNSSKINKDKVGNSNEEDKSKAINYPCLIIAQHYAPRSHCILIQLLRKKTSWPIEEVRDNLNPKPGHIYVIPPGTNCYVKNKVLYLKLTKNEYNPCPSIDSFFLSMANELGPLCIGVIVSGAGIDGALGIQAIKAEGGYTISQDPREAKNPSTPETAIAGKCVDIFLPANNISSKIFCFIKDRNELLSREIKIKANTDTLDEILLALKDYKGVDFLNYKKGTVLRRVRRRMIACGFTNLEHYLSYIRCHDKEFDCLFKDMLIHVTDFFRNKACFDRLKEEIITFMSNIKEGSSIRIWVPGCATGEEAYSLAILFAEAAGNLETLLTKYRFRIFATDINSESLNIARKGVFLKTALKKVPQNIQKKYFRNFDNKLEFSKKIRDIIVFCRHNVLTDAPFLHIDLISCRNLLIYFNNDLQDKVLTLFHYSLNSDGLLFLGKSECLGNLDKNFITISSKEKIFRKKVLPGLENKLSSEVFQNLKIKSNQKDIAKFDHDFTDAIIAAFEPDSLLINQSLDVLRIYGDVKNYTKLSPGNMNLHVCTIVREEFRHEIRAIVCRMKKENISSYFFKKELKTGEILQDVTVNIHRISPKNIKDYLFIISFSNHEVSRKEKNIEYYPKDNLSIQQLEEKLLLTQEHLESVVEELEFSNEEMYSTNEELQSSNEQLETTNEELQATNEELLTVNDELQLKSSNLISANQDMENIKESIVFPLIVVDHKAVVTQYNKACSKVISVQDGIYGKLLIDLNGLIDVAGLYKNTQKVIKEKTVLTSQIQIGKCFYEEKIIPYVTEYGAVTGAIITYTDDTLKQSTIEECKKNSEKYLSNLIKTGVFWLDWDIIHDKIIVGPLIFNVLGYDHRSFITVDDFKSLIHPEDLDFFLESLDATFTKNFDLDTNLQLKNAAGGYLWFRIQSKIIRNQAKSPIYAYLTIHNISNEKEATLKFQNNFSLCNDILEYQYKSLNAIRNKYFSIATPTEFSKMEQEVCAILDSSKEFLDIKEKKYQFTKTNLKKIIQKAIDSQKDSLAKSKIKFCSTNLPLAHVDKTHITYFWQQLINVLLEKKLHLKQNNVLKIELSYDESQNSNIHHFVIKLKLPSIKNLKLEDEYIMLCTFKKIFFSHRGYFKIGKPLNSIQIINFGLCRY